MVAADGVNLSILNYLVKVIFKNTETCRLLQRTKAGSRFGKLALFALLAIIRRSITAGLEGAALKGRVLIGLALLALSMGADAKMFKCVDEQGRVTFSQVPCPGQVSEAVSVKVDRGRHEPVSPPRGDPALDRKFGDIQRSISSSRQRGLSSAQPEKRTYCKTFNSTSLRTMIVKRQVVSGMTRENALSAWGKPERVNGDQYVYHWPEASAYFYVAEDGCVSAVQGTFRGK